MTYFLFMSLICGILILLISVFTKCVNNRMERGWRYVIWIVLAVRMLIPVDIALPVFTIDLSQEGVQETATQIIGIQAELPLGEAVLRPSPSGRVTTPIVQNPTETPVEPIRPSVNWTQVWAGIWSAMPGIWLTGVILLGIWYMVGYWYQRHELLRWSYWPGDDSLRNRLNEYRDELGIRQGVELRICKRISSPMMIGLFRPILLMPEGYYGEKKLRYIFQHELLHVKYGDVWVKTLMLMARVMHWFNPVVILMCEEMSEDIEILCDARVVKGLDGLQRLEYNQVLLQYLARRKEERMIFSTCFGSRKAKAKARLVQVSKNGTMRKGYGLCALLLCIVMVGSLFTSCTTEPEDESEEQKVEEMQKEMQEELEALEREAFLQNAYYSRLAKFSTKTEQEQTRVLPDTPDSHLARAYYQKIEGERVYVRLLDMNADGTLEMFAAYDSGDQAGQQKIYTFNGKSAVLLDEREISTLDVTGRPYTQFIRKEGKIYINISDQCGLQGHYVTWEDREMVTLFQYESPEVREDGYASFNGEIGTWEEVQQKMNEFLGDYDMLWISYEEKTAGSMYNIDYETDRIVDGMWGAMEGNGILRIVEYNWQLNRAYGISVDETRAIAAYQQFLEQCGAKHQLGYVYDFGDLKAIKGIGHIQLIDFNGDGISELYVTSDVGGVGQKYEAIYEFKYGNVQLIYSGELAYEGLGLETKSVFLTKGDRVYLKKEETLTGGYCELINGRMITVIYWETDLARENFWVNGEQVDYETYIAAIEEFEEGGEIQQYRYFGSEVCTYIDKSLIK